MDLIMWPLLGTTSRRALTRTQSNPFGPRRGQPYIYNPRRDLVKRLERDTGWERGEIVKQLRKERDYLLREMGLLTDNDR